MDQAHPIMHDTQRELLQACPLSAKAPFEIYGAKSRGCRPGDLYLYQGFRYVQNTSRDVLIREDVDQWIKTQQQTLEASRTNATSSSQR